MKHQKSKYTAINANALTFPDTAIPFPQELTQTDWLGYLEKLNRATRDSADSPQLTQCERDRFSRNCELVRRVGVAIEIRNYVLLEIHETKQWRADYRTIKEFAQAVGLSKSHLHKCINAARINLLMTEAGLLAVGPKGRQVELLTKKIEPKHQVEAWRHVLHVAHTKGDGIKVIEMALDAFSEELANRDAKLQDANCKKKVPLTIENAVIELDNHASLVPTQIEWISSLEPSEEQLFGCLLTIETWHATRDDPHQSRGRSIAQALVSAALGTLENKREIDDTLEAIKLATRKDRRLKRAFFRLGLQLMAKHVNEVYFDEHQI
jgi:hypothetical protein